jgi:hypothetical protein
MCTHYGEEWGQPGCYVYALWTGVVVARMLYTYTHTHTHTHCGQEWWLPKCYTHTLWSGVVATSMLYSCNVDRSGDCQDTIHMH